MIQKIPDMNWNPCTVLWDTGAQISLITHEYAKEAGFKALCCWVEPTPAVFFCSLRKKNNGTITNTKIKSNKEIKSDYKKLPFHHFSL
jgi:hypothetical protein